MVTSDARLAMKVWTVGGLVVSPNSFVKWLTDFKQKAAGEAVVTPGDDEDD